MTPRTRVFRAIRRVGRGDFPLQLDITDLALQRLGAQWGFAPSPASCFTVLHHHLAFARPTVRQIGEAQESRAGEVDAWGVRWSTDHEGIWAVEYPLARVPDLRGYQLPDVCARLEWKAVAEVVDRYAAEYCVVGYHNALLFERAWALRGFEQLLLDLADDFAAVEALFDAITEAQVQVAHRFVDMGIDVARTGDDWGGQHGMLFAPAVWRKLIRPRLAAIWRVYQSHNVPIIHHSCGDIRPVLDDLVDLGLDVLNPVQPEAMPLDEIAQRYGPCLSFYGGVSEQKSLPFGTPEDIKTEVRHCVERLGRYGGYIIAPSQAVMSDVPAENIHAFLDAMLMHCDLKG